MIGALADWFAVVALFRCSCDDFVRSLIVKLRTDPLYRLKGGQVRDQLLASPAVGEYLQGMWTQLRDWLKSDLASADSSIKAQVNSAVLDVGRKLNADPQIMQWLNETAERMATCASRTKPGEGRKVHCEPGKRMGRPPHGGADQTQYRQRPSVHPDQRRAGRRTGRSLALRFKSPADWMNRAQRADLTAR